MNYKNDALCESDASDIRALLAITERQTTPCCCHACISEGDAHRIVVSDFCRSVFEGETGDFAPGSTREVIDALLANETPDFNECLQCVVSDKFKLKVSNIVNTAKKYFITPYQGDGGIPFSMDTAFTVHRELMSGLLPMELCGKKRENNAGPRGEPFSFAPPSIIEPRLAELFKATSKKIEALLMQPKGPDRSVAAFGVAVPFFSEFLLIHPFVNGNGRTARFMCMLLFRVLSVFHPFSVDVPREEYLNALRARWSKDLGPLFHIFAASFKKSVSMWVWLVRHCQPSSK